MQPRALVEADLSGWRGRLPLSVSRVGPTLVLVVLIIVSFAASTAFFSSGGRVTADDVDAWPNVLGALAFGTVLALPVLVAMVPTVAIWLVPIVAPLEFIDPTLRSVRWWWLAAGGFALVLVVADRVEIRRQRAIARHWDAVTVPDLRPDVRRRLLAVRVLPGLLVAGSLLLVAVGGAFWVKDRAAAGAFRSDAVVTSGVVTGLADDQVWADVRVGARVQRVPLSAVDRTIGEDVQVRHATDWSRAELVDDVFDPTGALVWVGLGLASALVVLSAEGARYASLRRLTRRGVPAVRMRMQPIGSARRSLVDRVRDTYPADLVPCDAPDGGGRVMARLRLTPIQAPGGQEIAPTTIAAPTGAVGAVAADDLDADLGEDDEGWGDGEEPSDDDEDRVWTDHHPTDEVLLARLHVDPSPSPSPQARREVVVVGLTRRGDWPLVLDDGWWLAAEGPASGATRLMGELPPGRPSVDWRASWARLERRWWRIWRHTGQAAPWLSVALVYFLGRWVWSSGSSHPPGLIHLFWAVPLAGYGWLLLVRPRLRVRRSGVWVRGYFVDRWVPWRRVVRVLADERGLVLRLPDGAIPVPAPQPSGWLLPGVDDPRVAALSLDDARRAGAPLPGVLGRSEAEDRETWRMSALPLIAVLWLAAFVVPALT